jgi:uncharacterized protein (TIGR02594 family)
MQLVICRAFIIAGAAVLLAGNSAFARPTHHRHRSVHSFAHHHYAHRHAPPAQEFAQTPEMNSYYSGPGSAANYALASDGAVSQRELRIRHRRQPRESVASTAGFAGFGGGSIVADARRYLGTNPTGRRSLWCGAFMDKVLRDTGHRGGGNLAKGYLHYGPRVSGPQLGAIAVMGRRGGGHVGLVSGVDANGNPIVISGNHNNTVAETVYPRSRILAYVMPGG